MAIDIGRIAYQAYVEKMMRTHSLDYFCRWEGLMQREKDAWRHAAVAVLQYIDQAKQDIEDDSCF